ncbi:MAG TPA: cupredoxin domain-containing protein [Thermoleophilaceae bacterium]
MQTKRYAGLLAAGVAGVLLVAGCGGGEKRSSGTGTTPSGTSTQAAPTGKASATVNVTETDFKLNPSNPSVKPGVVEFKVKNSGQTVHSLEVEGPNGEVRLPSQLNPGDSSELKADLAKPGKYEWYCPVDNHKQMGMKGTITVGSSGSAGSSTTDNGSTDTTGSSRGY